MPASHPFLGLEPACAPRSPFSYTSPAGVWLQDGNKAVMCVSSRPSPPMGVLASRSPHVSAACLPQFLARLDTGTAPTQIDWKQLNLRTWLQHLPSRGQKQPCELSEAPLSTSAPTSRRGHFLLLLLHCMPFGSFCFFSKKPTTLHLFCLHALGWCSSFILKGKKCSNPCSSMGTLQSLVNESCWVFKEGAGGAACCPVSSVGLAEVSGQVLASGFRS